MSVNPQLLEWYWRIDFEYLADCSAWDFDHEARKDIAQEARIKVWKCLDDPSYSFATEGALRGFTRRVVLNEVQTARRKRAARRTHETAAASPHDASTHVGTARIEFLDLWSRVVRPCIEALNDKQRRVLESYYLRGASYDDLLKAEEVTPDYLKRLLYLARKNVKECLETNGITSYPAD